LALGTAAPHAVRFDSGLAARDSSVPRHTSVARGTFTDSMGVGAFTARRLAWRRRERPAEEPLLWDAPGSSTSSMQPAGMPVAVFVEELLEQTPVAEANVELAAELPRDVLDRLVFSVLQAMFPGHLDELRAPRAAALVLQLRRRVACAFCCTVLTVPGAMWLLLRGVAAYLATDSPACSGPFRLWLIGFLLLQLSWPVCMPWMGLLLLARYFCCEKIPGIEIAVRSRLS